MAEEEFSVVELRNDFYRDSFGKIIFVMISIFIAIIFLIAVSLYIYLNKPKPITFPIYDDWRVLAAVPLDQPYLTEPDLLQWVSEVLPRSFNLDFVSYNDQLKNYKQYFTQDGWQAFLNQLNIYANYNNVQKYRIFVSGAPSSAPIIINQTTNKANLLSGRYAWWVQMPVAITYAGYRPPPSLNLTLQVLVVRVSTLNNLSGVSIENVILAQNPGNQSTGNI